MQWNILQDLDIIPIDLESNRKDARLKRASFLCLVSSDVEINPQFYWGKIKSFSNEKTVSYMQAENSMV